MHYSFQVDSFRASALAFVGNFPPRSLPFTPGVAMILEVAVMKIKPELIAKFEAVFPKAAAISASTPGYISHEMQRCVETKGKYHYLIRWESIEAHEVNFRQSPRRQEFRNLLAEFFAEPTVAEHFEAVTSNRI
jgi:heme-degrading monooxygenase HmoA